MLTSIFYRSVELSKRNLAPISVTRYLKTNTKVESDCHSACWKCGKEKDCCQLFCSNCGKIQPVEGGSCCNYFELLNM